MLCWNMCISCKIPCAARALTVPPRSAVRYLESFFCIWSIEQVHALHFRLSHIHVQLQCTCTCKLSPARLLALWLALSCSALNVSLRSSCLLSTLASDWSTVLSYWRDLWDSTGGTLRRIYTSKDQNWFKNTHLFISQPQWYLHVSCMNIFCTWCEPTFLQVCLRSLLKLSSSLVWVTNWLPSWNKFIKKMLQICPRVLSYVDVSLKHTHTHKYMYIHTQIHIHTLIHIHTQRGTCILQELESWAWAAAERWSHTQPWVS